MNKYKEYLGFHSMSLILVDTREPREFKEMDNVRVQQLDVGDFHVLDANGVVKVIVERKTMNDLAASIVDNRWREQKSRMKSTGCVIVYIIEEMTCPKKMYKPVMSAMLNTVMRDKVQLFRTKHVQETAHVLGLIRDKLCEFENCQQPETNIETSIALSGRTFAKKEQYTDAAIWIAQLTCIPGVSVAIAKIIAEQFKGPIELCHASIGDILEVPRIGKTMATRIKSFFHE